MAIPLLQVKDEELNLRKNTLAIREFSWNYSAQKKGSAIANGTPYEGFQILTFSDHGPSMPRRGNSHIFIQSYSL